MTRTILAFGDSLTYGADAETGGRHPFEDRWPSALEVGLGGAARVIAEGLGGRTTMFDDHGAAADRNGARILPTLLGSHSPLDLLIVMLGTNDLKPHVCGTAQGAGAGMERLVEIARTYPYGAGATAPQVLIVAPPLFGPTVGGDWQPAGGNGADESRKLAPRYREAADYCGCAFFDAAAVATASPVDGIHLDAANTRAIGAALVPVVRQLLGLG
ncbi:SGNH/GDSL hydrolase family protein [Inquilinus sp.]|uniref:SGNH/GDSL hydrolase family protein n=1 Tax=Inquilinus sp. TaxID=1932117 RepID=UPI0031D0155E